MKKIVCFFWNNIEYGETADQCNLASRDPIVFGISAWAITILRTFTR